MLLAVFIILKRGISLPDTMNSVKVLHTMYSQKKVMSKKVLNLFQLNGN